MFEITNVAIDKMKLEECVNSPKAGAVVSFDGRVRNHNEGEDVSSLEYECYESMALKVGDEIMMEAQDLYDIHLIKASHRMGHLKIGEAAVIVAASASHRDEAFKACRYIIDEIKHRVPIWKKEHYVNKPAKWVACHGCAKKAARMEQQLNG